MLERGKRNRWLDIVRMSAIVGVINCHVASAYSTEYGGNWMLSLLGLGGHGVDLFFVLSGWLLGHVLFRELDQTGTIQVGRFLKRRWFRTLPAYYAVLAMTFLQAIIQDRFEWQQLSYLVFAQRYWYDVCPFFGVSWSLCVEEHFYLVIAPALLWIGKSNGRALVLFACLMLTPLLLRSAGLYGSLQETHVRLDQCAAGVGLAFLHQRYNEAILRFLNAQAVLAALVGLTAWIIAARLGYLPGQNLVMFTVWSALVVVLSAQGRWWADKVQVPGAYYIASRSYSMYLLHVEAIALVRRLEVQSFVLQLVIVWGVTLLLAEVLYRFVELPFMSYRKRTQTSGAAATVSVSGNL